MSGKNRAFALAIATAALVGFSAPMAMAATTYGPSNTGFNGDSVLNLSGNQLPINACNNQIPVQGIGAQLPLQNITGILGLGNYGDTASSTNTSSCTNTPTETNTPTINSATSATSTTPMMSAGPNDPSNTGFNHDSVLKVSGNQLPVNLCNNQIPLQLIGAQIPAENLFAAIDALGTGNTATGSQTEGCTNTPTETNTPTVNS
jgi:hypothetical protein